jgi:ABC-type sulfate/molybdate transport systems ATPase subunit
MALEPDILLMDEPFAALDALTRRSMQQELLSLWDQLRFTVMFVTHSIEEAVLIGSRVLVLSPHPGRVRAELDTDRLNYNNMDQAEFGVMSKRIHDLLFGDKPHHAGAKEGAAALWVKNTHSKLPVEEVARIVKLPENEWTMTPKKTMVFAEYMSRVGMIPVKPTSWKDYYIDAIHNLPGS